MWKVLWAAGTRPELIKMAPVVKQLQRSSDVELSFLWSGQHYDYNMSQIFMDELSLPEPDYRLAVGSIGDRDQISKIVSEAGKVISVVRPDVVLVQGDTNTTAGVAIASSKGGVPLAHVEAGLRSFDKRMPEEVNRMIASVCTDLHFAPTQVARDNLVKEGVPAETIHVTGNTIVDVLNGVLPRLPAPRARERRILVTIHRQESVDTIEAISGVVGVLTRLASVAAVLLPVHPRTRSRLVEFGLWDKLERIAGLKITEPMGYEPFLRALATSSLVVTDSGGVQEEAYILDVPTLTLRDNTERPETVLHGRNLIVGTSPGDIAEDAAKNIDPEARRVPLIPNALGDGKAGPQIASQLVRSLSEGLTIRHSIQFSFDRRQA